MKSVWKIVGKTKEADERWKKLLRKRLQRIRDEAEEISMQLELSGANEWEGPDALYELARSIMKGVATAMANGKGELEYYLLPDEPETPQTDIAKAKTIIGEIVSDEKWVEAYLADLDRGLELLAKRYQVEVIATGGGCDVVLIPVGKHSCIAIDNINGGTVCGFFYAPKVTDPYEIFWQWQGDGINESLSFIFEKDGSHE